MDLGIKKRFAIDLTWVRHGIVGGTELFACNILDGFLHYIRKILDQYRYFCLRLKTIKRFLNLSIGPG